MLNMRNKLKTHNAPQEKVLLMCKEQIPDGCYIFLPYSDIFTCNSKYSLI